MSVGAIGSAILVNQMTPTVTPLQGNQNTRFDLQNVAAQAAVQEKEKEVEEVRPTEESHAVDPDREHNKQETEEEMSEEMEKSAKKDEESDKEIEEEDSDKYHHLLDIKV